MRIAMTLAAGLLFAAIASAAPVKEGDPILIGTKWTGKLTQRGTFTGGGVGPADFDIVFVITKRDGNTFEAELLEKTPSLKITYLVKGEIAKTADGKGHTVKFESYDSKDQESTTPILGIPYTATLTGKSMKGTWKLKRSADETNIEGDFNLDLGK